MEFRERSRIRIHLHGLYVTIKFEVVFFTSSKGFLVD